MWGLLLVFGRAAATSPVDMAISLLTDLESQVQTDGAAEATQYEVFACFCKDKQVETSGRMTTTEEEIAQLEKDIAKGEAERDKQAKEMARLELLQDQQERDLTAMMDLRENEKAAHSQAVQDASSGKASATAAITAIEAGKTPSLLELGLSAHTLANAAGDFHSDDLLGMLEGLETQFADRKTALDTAEASAVSSATAAFDGKQGERDASALDLTTATGLKTAEEEDIATNEGELTEKRSLLASDTKYLHELQAECETKARAWDQRSGLRKSELTAIGAALTLLEGKVADASAAKAHGAADEEFLQVASSFLQLHLPHHHGHQHKRPHSSAAARRQVHYEARDVHSGRSRALALVEAVRDTMKGPASAVLLTAAMHLQADPMAKVKTMIQQLIERLLTQAKDEAAHKGWCDTEMGTAEHSRDSRHAKTVDLNAELEGLEARESELKSDRQQLRQEIMTLDSTFLAAQKERQAESAENKRVLKEARNGMDALSQVISLLEDFYRGAARAKTSFLQRREDPPNAMDDIAAEGGAGFDGANTGSQESAHGVLGALGVVKADFQRTVDTTTDSEKQSARDFQSFEQMSKAASKERQRGLEQVEAEEETTAADLAAGMEDLSATQGLLDKALELLEGLRPNCEYNGMSYDEHKERREAEVAALKSAICLMDGGDEKAAGC